MLSSRETHFALTVPLSTSVYECVLVLSIANVMLWVILHWTSILQGKCLMNLDEFCQYGTLSLMETFEIKDTLENQLNNVL